MDSIYPNHVNALRETGLAPPIFPTMGELWKYQDIKTYLDKENDLDVNKKRNKNVYFCVAYSRYFSTSIHKVIEKLKNN